MVFIGIFFAMLFWAGVPAPLLLLAASPAISLVLAFSTGLWGAWFLLFLAVVLIVQAVRGGRRGARRGQRRRWAWPRRCSGTRSIRISRTACWCSSIPAVTRSGSAITSLQSKIAIGSGGWLGKGFTAGTQKRLAFLPEQHTDFIFAVVGEELGFIGVTVALALFLFLFLRVIRVATRANDSFSSLLAFGLAGSWLVHVVVNIGMTINLMPITGIPLPFFCYGGSFMLACWIAIGMLVRISSEGRGTAGELAHRPAVSAR